MVCTTHVLHVARGLDLLICIKMRHLYVKDNSTYLMKNYLKEYQKKGTARVPKYTGSGSIKDSVIIR